MVISDRFERSDGRQLEVPDRNVSPGVVLSNPSINMVDLLGSQSPSLCRLAEPVPPNSSPTMPKDASINGVSVNTPNPTCKPKTFSEAVTNTIGVVNEKAKFSLAGASARDVTIPGKCSTTPLAPFSIAPNLEMLAEIY